MTVTESRTKRLLIKDVDNILNEYKVPFLAKTTLRLVASKKMGFFMNGIPKMLKVGDEAIDEVVDLLAKEELLTLTGAKSSFMDGRELRLTEDGKLYAKSEEAYGFVHVPQWDGLSKDETKDLMRKLEPLCTFSYDKAFYIPLKDLEPLKNEMHEAVKKLHEKEDAFLQKCLKFPKGSKTFLGFSRTDDPTWKDGAGHIDPFSIHVLMNYQSIGQAFEDNFGSASGTVRLDAYYEKDGKRHECFPSQAVDVNSYKEECSVRVWPFPMSSNVLELPLLVQQEAHDKMKELCSVVKGLYAEKMRPK